MEIRGPRKEENTPSIRPRHAVFVDHMLEVGNAKEVAGA